MGLGWGGNPDPGAEIPIFPKRVPTPPDPRCCRVEDESPLALALDGLSSLAGVVHHLPSSAQRPALSRSWVGKARTSQGPVVDGPPVGVALDHLGGHVVGGAHQGEVLVPMVLVLLVLHVVVVRVVLVPWSGLWGYGVLVRGRGGGGLFLAVGERHLAVGEEAGTRTTLLAVAAVVAVLASPRLVTHLPVSQPSAKEVLRKQKS